MGPSGCAWKRWGRSMVCKIVLTCLGLCHMPKYARCWFVVTFSWTGIIWFEKSSESQHHVTCGPWWLYSTPIANANFSVMNCWQLIDRGILHCNIGGSQLWASHCEHTCWWCTRGMYGFYPPTTSYLPSWLQADVILETFLIPLALMCL
jgi:hypothetical protein